MPYATSVRKAAYMKIYRKQYNSVHHEKIALYEAAYYRINHDRLAAEDKIEHIDHRQEDNERCSAYYASHREERDAYEKEWNRTHPEQAKIAWDRHNATRRILGFVPINLPFDGAEGHHLDKEYVVYIPKGLHRSISHNVFTGRNMAAINTLASAWIPKETT